MTTLYPIGLTLPIQNGDGGFFNQTIYTLEQVKNNIRNLLSTKKGERRMQPTFGHSLNNFVFDPNDTTLIQRVKQSLTTDINFWIPVTTIDNIDVIEALTQSNLRSTSSVSGLNPFVGTSTTSSGSGGSSGGGGY